MGRGARCAPAAWSRALNYTGQRLDGTGLLYYHARYYDPVLGRFHQCGYGGAGAVRRAAWMAWRSRA